MQGFEVAFFIFTLTNIFFMKEEIKAFNNVLELIGNTPLIKLNAITNGLEGNFYAKVEAFNPGHSTKDRIALYIIEEAERKGILTPGDTIIETTSGNTGFSLAMVSIIKGYNCILAVSSKSSKDKIDMLRSMGAKVYVCPAHVSADDERSYYNVAKRLHEETKGSVYINQYFNELNIDAHYKTTGPEIWEQTQGKITHLIACSGTGGTISGTAKFLKEQNPNIKIIGVQPEEGSQIPGIRKWPEEYLPSIYDAKRVDELIYVGQVDAEKMTRRLAAEEGIFAGISSGGALHAALQLSKQVENAVIVSIVCDRGDRYLSTGVFPS